MKKLIIALVIMTSVACTSSTPGGQCIGAFDDKEPNKKYSLSKWNTFLGLFFVETIFVPIIVVATETLCPVEQK